MSSLFRRIGWASLDQAFASISNLLLSVAIARQSSADEFGAFGLAFALYLMAVGVSRSIVGDPTLLRAPEWELRGARYHRRNRDGMLSASLMAGLGVAVALVIGSSWLSFDIRAILIAMACAIPGVVVFDALRYWYFANAGARQAAMMDLAWLLLQIVFFGLLVVMVRATAVTLIIAWAVAGILPVLILAFRTGSRFSIYRGIVWFKRNKDLSWNFLGEYITLSGVQQGVTFLTAAFAGLASVGSIRAAQTILGPVNIITGSASVIVLPQSRARLTKNPRKLPLFSLQVSGILASVIAVACATVALIPAEWGREILGASWQSGQHIALILGISLALNSISYGATSGLRAMEAGRVSLQLRVITAPIALLLVAVGAAIGAAEGAVTALVVASAIQCIAWWAVYLIFWRRFLAQESRGM